MYEVSNLQEAIAARVIRELKEKGLKKPRIISHVVSELERSGYDTIESYQVARKVWSGSIH